MALESWQPASRIREGAQRAAGRWVERVERLGPATHYALAAEVTAGCRARLVACAARAPARVIALATDAVYFAGTAPVPGLRTGAGLGAWDAGETGPDSVWVLPGVYATRDTSGVWHEKGRGLRLSGDALLAALATDAPRTGATVTEAASIRQAIRRHRPETLNVILARRRIIDPNAETRRIWPREWARCRDVLAGAQRSAAPVIVDVGRGRA